MLRRACLVAVLALAACSSPAPRGSPIQVRAATVVFPFEANVGQLDPRVAFAARHGGVHVHALDDGLLLSLPGREPRERYNVGIELVDASRSSPRGIAAGVDVGAFAFHGGAMTRRPSHESILYRNAWPGIDVVVERGPRAIVKTSYIVSPGASTEPLRLRWHGAIGQIDERGALHMETPVGALVESPPLAYQPTTAGPRPVAARYELLEARADSGAERSFDVAIGLGQYDRSLPLIIDPELTFATYLSGVNRDEANAIAVDALGNVYVGGETASFNTSFPDGDGVGSLVGFDTVFGQLSDGFIARLNPDGTSLGYLTYLGGDGIDGVNAIVLDADRQLYATGRTSTPANGFPGNSGFGSIPGWDQTPNGGLDAFAVKLSTDGASVLFATYLGGAGTDVGRAIALDGDRNVYIAGTTESGNATFPSGAGFGTTTGFDRVFNGVRNGFVAKFGPTGTTLAYCTYLGGDDVTEVHGLAADGAGNAHAVGFTRSTESTFPTTSGFGTIPGYDQSMNGGQSDAFIVKLDAAGTSLAYATFLGGSGDDEAHAVTLDGGDAIVAGHTTSTAASFPVVGGFDLTHNGGSDGFVARFGTTGTTLAFATYLGGAAADSALSVARATDGSVVVGGATSSDQHTFLGGLSALPSVDGSYNAGGDGFVVVSSANGQSVSHATYLGGPLEDEVRAIAVHADGNPRVAGFTKSTESSFPTGAGFGAIPGFHQEAEGGPGEAFVIALGLVPTMTPTATSSPSLPPTSTPPPTLTPTVTRTPLPTLTPTPGRERSIAPWVSAKPRPPARQTSPHQSPSDPLPDDRAVP